MQSNLRTILFALVLLLAVRATDAQRRFEITQYGQSEGLAQGIVTQILQDKRGYMWFSTWDGLVRYDGYNFKTYKGRPGDGNKLPTNRFERLVEDANGNIWSRVARKAIFFDTRTERFTNPLTELDITEANQPNLKFILPLANRVIWLFYEGGIAFRVDLSLPFSKGTTEFSPQKQANMWGQVKSVFLDSKGREWILGSKQCATHDQRVRIALPQASAIAEWNNRLYIGSGFGTIGCWDDQAQTYKPILLNVSLGTVTSLTPLDEDRLFITSQSLGAFCYNRRSPQPITSVKLPPLIGGLLSAYKDGVGNLWLEPEQVGTILYEIISGKTTLMANSGFIPRLERHDPTYIINEDVNGIVWISPKDRNLWCYDRKFGKTQTLLQLLGRKQPNTVDPIVRGFFPDRQGSLWVNTIDRGITKLSFYDPKYQFIEIPDVVEVRAFLNDHLGNTWVASKDECVRIYAPDNRLIGYLTPQGRISNHPTSIGMRIYCIHQDSRQRIWIGSKEEGLVRLTPQQHLASYRWDHYRHNPADPFSLSSNNIYDIIEDSDQQIWIGTYGGGINLARSTPEGTVEFINPHNLFKNYPYQAANRIRCLSEIDAKHLLIGTMDGLILLTRQGLPNEWTFDLYQRDEMNIASLSNNDVMDIVKTRSGQVYLATSGGGLDRVFFSLKEGEKALSFKSFTQKDGLTSDQILSLAPDNDGNLWLTSENALTRFYPADQRVETYSNTFFRRRFVFSEASPILSSHGELIVGCTQGFVSLDVHKIVKSKFIPPIGFTELRVHNKSDQTRIVHNIEYIDKISLKADERNISIQFAALDFLPNASIRYTYRLAGLEKNWNTVDNAHSTIYTNLPYGTYTFEVRSTNSEGQWVDNLRTLMIRIEPRFIETPWFYLLIFLLGVTLIIVGVYVYLMIYKLRHQVVVEEQLNQLKLQFFTDISHELRTPLTLISSPLDEIIAHESLSQKARRNLHIVRRNTDRLLNLVNQILDFRKVQNNKMRLQLEELDLVVMLQSIMENFALVADERHIRFAFASSSTQLRLWVDRDKIEKIVFNLLSNAFKYTNPDKSILISIDETDDEAIISIRDEGEGFNSKQLEKIFGRFESFLKNNHVTPSTGIGLSLVKSLIDLHHGRIELQSEEGKGSCFSIFLSRSRIVYQDDPIVEFVVSEAILPPDEEFIDDDASERKERTTTILVVEDNEELRYFLVEVLSSEYRVVSAVDGAEGLVQIRRYMPDLILSDVMMPGMDGLEMVRHIKQDKTLCHILIILLSAKSSLDDRVKGLETGIDDYMTKPFSASFLRIRIAALLDRQREMQSLICASISIPSASELQTLPPRFIQVEPDLPQIQSLDEQFLFHLMAILEKEMGNSDLVIDDLAESLCMSRTVFYKKLKTLTGLSPVEFLRSIRIKRAAQLIATSCFTLSEVAYQTGFSDPKYFSKCFKKEFGKSPSAFKADVGEE